MKRIRYKQTESGDWVTPVMRGYRMRCCDFGLVHELNFKIKGRSVTFQVIRNERATAASRRKTHG